MNIQNQVEAAAQKTNDRVNPKQPIKVTQPRDKSSPAEPTEAEHRDPKSKERARRAGTIIAPSPGNGPDVVF